MHWSRSNESAAKKMGASNGEEGLYQHANHQHTQTRQPYSNMSGLVTLLRISNDHLSQIESPQQAF